jgi:hypothetical protein
MAFPSDDDIKRLSRYLNAWQYYGSSNDAVAQYGDLPIAKWNGEGNHHHYQFLLRPMKSYNDYNTLGGQVVTKDTQRTGNLFLPVGAVVFSFDPNIYTTELQLRKVIHRGQDYYYFGRIPFGTKVGGSQSTANGRNWYSKYAVMPADGWYLLNIRGYNRTGIHYLPLGANQEFYAYGGSSNNYWGRSMIYSATRPTRAYVETAEAAWFDTGEASAHGFSQGTGFYYLWPERDHRPTAADVLGASNIADPAIQYLIVDVQRDGNTGWQNNYKLQDWMFEPPVVYY